MLFRPDMANKSSHHQFGCSYYLRSQAVFPNIRASFVAAASAKKMQQTTKQYQSRRKPNAKLNQPNLNKQAKIVKVLERWLSGLRRTPGKCV
jgi:hypothetical protein